jgi:hypothetical protein
VHEGVDAATNEVGTCPARASWFNSSGVNCHEGREAHEESTPSNLCPKAHSAYPERLNQWSKT